MRILQWLQTINDCNISFSFSKPFAYKIILITVCLSVFPNIQVTMSGNHYLMLTTVGELYTWGSNEAGQLGMGNRVNQVGCLVLN